MNAIPPVGWLAVPVALAGLGWWLRRSEGRLDSPAKAARLAEEMLAGFAARRALVGTDGAAALVAGNGTIAVLRRRGARVRAGRVVPPLRLREAIEGVIVETGEGLFGSVTLFGVIADDVHRLQDVPANG